MATYGKFWLKKEMAPRNPKREGMVTGAFPRDDLDHIVAFDKESLDALWNFEDTTGIQPVLILSTTKGEIHYFDSLKEVKGLLKQCH